MILGPDKSKFPSGNALFLNLKRNKILIDTNPGAERISKFLRSQFDLSLSDITDIILSHAHLDHARGLAAIFERSDSNVYGHPDTLKRCEKKSRVGLYAGIPKKDISHFKAFGKSLGFMDRKYPSSKKFALEEGQEIEFNNIKLIAHETNAHCLHMLDYEIIDGNYRGILSCDYDFTPIPWYGVPQRGKAVNNFKNATKKLVERNADFIISSHRTKPIWREQQEIELKKYLQVIDARTERAIKLLPSNKAIKLKEIDDFVYPISKMEGHYSKDYQICAQAWDIWILLAHLEEGWRLGKVKCIEGDGDKFLEHCIQARRYLPNRVDDMLVDGWAEKTLQEKMPYSLPLNSMWERHNN
jgi:glyoxylase-like metal-dependent hydrolase (beta-lactamase superfamily II)